MELTMVSLIAAQPSGLLLALILRKTGIKIKPCLMIYLAYSLVFSVALVMYVSGGDVSRIGTIASASSGAIENKSAFTGAGNALLDLLAVASIFVVPYALYSTAQVLIKKTR